MKNEYIGFVGTTSTNGSKGVYKIALDRETGAVRVLDTQPAYNSGYLALSRDKKTLYVLSEGMTFRGRATGGITAYDVSSGGFAERGWAYTDGQRPCFVDSDPEAGEIYVGNFFNGTLAVFEMRPDGGVGSMKAYLTHEKRGPFGPGVHCAVKAPNAPYLAGIEISGNVVYLYDCTDGYRRVFETCLPDMSGPRHMTFSPDGRFLYVNRQNDEKVTVFRFCPGEPEMLREIQTVDARNPDMVGRTELAAIRLCPGHSLLAVSHRGRGRENREDAVTLFSIDPETGLLTWRQAVRCGGEMPRDVNFTPDGRFLVAGYQSQNYLDVYRLDEETQTLQYAGRGPDIPSPVCIAF